MSRRLAIIRYKLAARRYRRRESDYAAMETARAAMLTACGYDRAYGYMGEFCNLHERDFPSHIRATSEPCHYDAKAASEGRIYRYSGWHSPVDFEQHQANGTRDRRRALELQRILELDPVDRFIRGWHVIYKGFDGSKVYAACWVNSREGVPYLDVYECVDMFGLRSRMKPIMGEDEARSFFAGLPEPAFQERLGLPTGDA